MSASAVKVLMIEDNLAEARLLREFLFTQPLGIAKPKQFSLVHVKRLGEALHSLEADHFDVVLLDLTLPDSQGLASLQSLLSRVPDLPIVVLTNTNDDELAVEAVRQGAQDYLVKRQVNGEVLSRALYYAIERQQAADALRRVNEALKLQVQEKTDELVRARELNRLKSDFVLMLSHDIRNPLNNILLSTGLLQDNKYKLTEENKLTHFQLIRSAVKNMAQLLDEVSLIGRADAGQLQSQRFPLDIVLFCQSLAEELQFTVGEQYQIKFTTQGEFGVALWDEALLRHILCNLLANAVKYSPAGGVIGFALLGQEQAVRFQIWDHGIGIPLADQSDLFQPFQRATNVDNIPGTGLGLAIAKRCTEAQGGTIMVTSEVGVGTTFTVTLPVVKTAR